MLKAIESGSRTILIWGYNGLKLYTKGCCLGNESQLCLQTFNVATVAKVHTVVINGSSCARLGNIFHSHKLLGQSIRPSN